MSLHDCGFTRFSKNPLLRLIHKYINLSLARDAFVKQIVALLTWCSCVCLSVCLFVWDGRALWSYGARLWTYGWIAQCSGNASWHQSMSTYSQPSFPVFHLNVISQERLKMKFKLHFFVIIAARHKRRVDWHNNGWMNDNEWWPWVTLNGCFTHQALSLQ